MIKEQASNNIQRIISSSLEGDGVLATHFGAVKEAFVKEEAGRNSLRKDNKLSPEEIEAKATERLHEYANGQIKDTLTKVSAGEPLSTSQEADLQKMAGMMGAVGQASSALGGGIFGILSFIPTLMSTFGDYIGAAYAYFFPDKNTSDASKSFGDALADIKAKKGIHELAGTLGVSGDELFKDLTKKPEPKNEEPKVATPNPEAAQAQAAVTPKPKTVTVDQHYSAPNGSGVPLQPSALGPVAPSSAKSLS